MISKRIDRSGKSSSFGRLGHYVLEAKNEEASILWTRTAEYVADLNGEGEKVLWSRLTNCEAEIPVLAIAEIEATQAKNTRSKADMTYHLVISFPEGEHPSREQLEDIEDRMCESLDFTEHQRISAVHKDTDNIHLHVAINKVHPQTLRCVEPYFDYHKRNRACRELEKKHGLHVDNGIGQGKRQGRAGDMEAHTGQESLLRWIQENAAEAIRACLEKDQDWQALHQTLASYGLEIRSRGAGLVIGLPGEKLSVKASSVDRKLSLKALTDQLGPFQESNRELPQSSVQKQYQKGQMPAQNQALYDAYQQQRQEALQGRETALAQLRQEHHQYTQDLKAWYQKQYETIRADKSLRGPEKRYAHKKLAQERQEDFAKRRELEASQRQAIRKAHSLSTWQGFLQDAAERGNTDALAILRNRQRRRERMAAELIRCENADQARHIVFQDLQPQVRKNGDTVYRVRDGGVVLDQVHQVQVAERTEGASFLALSLAEGRFKGLPLIVEGSNEFKHQVAQFAAKQGLDVRFADPALEQTRQLARRPKSQQQLPTRNLH